MNLSGLKIGIWGFGKEGQSLYHYLNALDGFDTLSILLDSPTADPISNIKPLLGTDAITAIQTGQFDLIFKSPGISLYKPEIAQAKSNGTKFSSATNLWFEENKKTKKIIITGTKGKSTTASLLYHVMKSSGLSVSLAGNVGIPLLDLKEETDYTILELSSYQLADLSHAPDIFLILNLFPEHLQWHLTHKNYYNDKLKPLELQGNFKVISNAQDEYLEESILRSKKDVEWFDKKKYAHIKTQLKGDHNQENIKAVLTICEELKINLSEVIPHIESFEPLPHRLQEFTSKEGVLCINDSISTTPESTIAATKVYHNKNKILILGGTDRGQNYTALIKHLKNISIKSILLLPENGEKIESALKENKFNPPILSFDNLTNASEWIKKEATKNDVVILSPAAPSHAQFNSFEERGDFFIKLMKA